jgi:hypothetical protein
MIKLRFFLGTPPVRGAHHKHLFGRRYSFVATVVEKVRGVVKASTDILYDVS